MCGTSSHTKTEPPTSSYDLFLDSKDIHLD
jgi:hypothetical protein